MPEGEIEGTIDTDGLFDFTGTCTVIWTSEEGEVIDAEVTGFVQDTTYVISMYLDDPDLELNFDSATATGDMADPLTAEAESGFLYDDDDEDDEKDAFIAVEISR